MGQVIRLKDAKIYQQKELVLNNINFELQANEIIKVILQRLFIELAPRSKQN